MKLQAKFTLNFILLVVLTIIISFFLINWSVEAQFQHFIEKKQQQWEIVQQIPRFQGGGMKKNERITILLSNPFDKNLSPNSDDTPENAYLHTVSRSLFLAAVIDIVVAFILAYFLSNFLLRRIYGLKSAMSQYMLDGHSRPVIHGEEDEVDELARIYNSLIAKIEKEEQIRREFFVDMSHELRTPLTAVKGYLEGLSDKVFDPEKEQDVQKKALHETDRMIHLVKEMTTLAKLETEKESLPLEETDLRNLTDEIAEMLAPQLQEKHLAINIQGEITAPLNQNKMKQVLINLLNNAIQHGHHPGTVTIEMGQHNNQNIFWKISNPVQPHLASEQVQFFFERFYRGDKSRVYESKKPHLGIGLNIVKKIIEQHQGQITANLEDHHITFEFKIPIQAH